MALEKQLMVGDILMGVDFENLRVGGVKEFITSGVIDTCFFVKRATERTKKSFLRNTIVEESEVFKIEFRWLPWADGKINYANLEGKDILSGFFTGCWMVLYKDQNLRVAHIATGNKDCKNLWSNAAPGFQNVKGFLPHLGNNNPFSLGLVTENTDLFKIHLTPLEEIAVCNPYRTVEEWMQPERNKHQVRSFAERMSKQKELAARVVYGGRSFRVTKIQGPMAPDPIPRNSEMDSARSEGG